MPLATSRSGRALVILALWAAGGVGAWFAAGAAATQIEQLSQDAAAQALAPWPWASVATDGLQVTLGGTAPTEVARFRAVEAAGTVVDARRVVDRIAVAQVAQAPAPDFAVELLRNDAGVSLIGLVPAGTDRAAILARLSHAADGAEVADLLQSADHAAPPGWDAALAYALTAAETTPRAKISIAPGKVGVTAITASPEEKARLQSALVRAKPAEVALTTEITTPRPVIAPFTLRFVIDAGGARFDACAADTEAARDRILAAAAAAGAGGTLGCTLGLGVPTPDWADAAVPAIAALAALGAGTVTLSDADIALDAPASVPQARFDEEIGRLEAALPEVFALTATLAKPDAPAPAPAEASAERSADGTVSLRGRITDERMREAVESLARARFARVDSALRIDPSVPAGWTVRVIAGVEAVAQLASGSVAVTPDLVRVTGVSGNPRASDEAAAGLARRLGAGARYALAIRYEPRLDPAKGLPDGPTCVDRGNAVLAKAEIGFAPNKAEIEGDIEPTLSALKSALADCADFRIEVGGHTDSQGSEGFNARLSADRAQAVLTAMAAEGIPAANLTAKGYGETVPVGDNETEAGREANRRIEFRLVSPEPVVTAPPAPAQEVSGVTGATPTPAADPVPAATLPPAQAPAELDGTAAAAAPDADPEGAPEAAGGGAPDAGAEAGDEAARPAQAGPDEAASTAAAAGGTPGQEDAPAAGAAGAVAVSNGPAGAGGTRGADSLADAPTAASAGPEAPADAAPDDATSASAGAPTEADAAPAGAPADAASTTAATSPQANAASGPVAAADAGDVAAAGQPDVGATETGAPGPTPAAGGGPDGVAPADGSIALSPGPGSLVSRAAPPGASLFGPDSGPDSGGRLGSGDLRIETVAPQGLTVSYDAPVADLPGASYTESDPTATRPAPRPKQP